MHGQIANLLWLNGTIILIYCARWESKQWVNNLQVYTHWLLNKSYKEWTNKLNKLVVNKNNVVRWLLLCLLSTCCSWLWAMALCTAFEKRDLWDCFNDTKNIMNIIKTTCITLKYTPSSIGHHNLFWPMIIMHFNLRVCIGIITIITTSYLRKNIPLHYCLFCY